MKKRILTLVLGVCLAITAVGCGDKADKSTKKESSKSDSSEDIIVKKYKGLEIEEPVYADVTDEDVEASIKSTLQTLATRKEISDRAVKEGDIVTMDYSGSIDGVLFDGGTDEGAELTIGSGQFIPGFEDQIIGHKVGETFDINVTFPEGYSEDLSGKAAVFAITLHKIEEEEIPELTEEILAKIGTDATTIEDYKKQVREDLEKSNAEAKENEIMQKLWEALINGCEVKKYPQDRLDEIKADIENEVGYVASYYGTTTEEFVKNYYGVTVEQMAKDLLAQEMAVDYIAKKEKINLTDKAYEEGVKELADMYGYTDVAEFEAEAGEEELKDMLLKNMVGEILKENCKFKK